MPPSRVRYAAYYHLWKTVVLNDKPPLFGVANRRVDSSDVNFYSPFEDFRKTSDGRYLSIVAVDKLLAQTKARYILLSYSAGNSTVPTELHRSMTIRSKSIKTIEIDYRKNVMSLMKWTNAWTQNNDKNKEFLFLLER